MEKPQNLEQYRNVVVELITETLDALGADYTTENVKQLANEIIYVGCPHIFLNEAGELPFADDVLEAGDYLNF